MKVIVRINKRHDMDLVALYKTPQYSLYKAIYNAMKSYVTGQTYLIKITQNTIDISKESKIKTDSFFEVYDKYFEKS